MLSTINNGGMKLRFRLKTGTSAGSGTATLIASQSGLTANQWIHVAAVYDGSQMKLYENGNFVGSLAKTGNIFVNPSVRTTVGINPDGYGAFDGRIKDVRIYDRALTQTELIGFTTASMSISQMASVLQAAEATLNSILDLLGI